MVQQQRLTNIGGYIGTIESTTTNNPINLCRVDTYTEPRRFQQAVRFFKRKFSTKDNVTTDMWLGSQAKVTSIHFDAKYQILRLEVSNT